MEIHDAIDRIHAIHAHVARSEVFRGYKPATVACTGVLALLAAWIQPAIIPEPHLDVPLYLQLWLSVAAISALSVAIELAFRWFRTDSLLRREQTLQALEQFLPCLVAGASVTWALVEFAGDSAHLLPGLWAVLFSLGVFASCRQMPRSCVAVGIYYLASGVVCLALARDAHALHPLAMAGTFGVGQLLTALVLYFSQESSHGKE